MYILKDKTMKSSLQTPYPFLNTINKTKQKEENIQPNNIDALNY